MNANKVININQLFSDCSLLSSLPDISKWNSNNLIKMIYLLNDFSSLSSLPDISKWNANNVTNKDNLINNCRSLLSLPHFSKKIFIIAKYLLYTTSWIDKTLLLEIFKINSYHI